MIILQHGKLENSSADIVWVWDWTLLGWYEEDITFHDPLERRFYHIDLLWRVAMFGTIEEGVPKEPTCFYALGQQFNEPPILNCQQQPKCSSKSAERKAIYRYWGEHQESQKRSGFFWLVVWTILFRYWEWYSQWTFIFFRGVDLTTNQFVFYYIPHCLRTHRFDSRFLPGEPAGAARLFEARTSNLGNSLWWLHHVGWVAWLLEKITIEVSPMAATTDINLHKLG